MGVVHVEGRQAGLFRAHKGTRLIAAHRRLGKTPFVAGSRMNNSITDFADTPAQFPAGWLTLIYNGDGGTGHAKYQPAPFSASDDVIALEPLCDKATEPALLLIASMLTQQCVPKFGFGYKLTLHRLGRQKVLVPVTANTDREQAVDWEGMTRLGEELFRITQERIAKVRTSSPDDDDTLPHLIFEPVLITDVFESMKASSAWYDKTNLKKGVGRNLYLSQTLSSNGLAEIVADQDVAPEAGQCITVTLKTQAVFYQPSPFYTAQNFLIFRHHSLDVDSGMLLVTALRHAAEKFSWGYGISMGRLKKTRIMVPVTTDDEGKQVVDWLGMSCYGRALRVRAESKIDQALKGAKPATPDIDAGAAFQWPAVETSAPTSCQSPAITAGLKFISKAT